VPNAAGLMRTLCGAALVAVLAGCAESPPPEARLGQPPGAKIVAPVLDDADHALARRMEPLVASLMAQVAGDAARKSFSYRFTRPVRVALLMDDTDDPKLKACSARGPSRLAEGVAALNAIMGPAYEVVAPESDHDVLFAFMDRPAAMWDKPIAMVGRRQAAILNRALDRIESMRAAGFNVSGVNLGLHHAPMQRGYTVAFDPRHAVPRYTLFDADRLVNQYSVLPCTASYVWSLRETWFGVFSFEGPELHIGAANFTTADPTLPKGDWSINAAFCLARGPASLTPHQVAVCAVAVERLIEHERATERSAG